MAAPTELDGGWNGGSRAGADRSRSAARRLACALGALLTLGACAASPDRASIGQSYERALVARGMLRLDPTPADAPYDNAVLIRNFERVVFDPERQLIEVDPAYAGRALTVRRWTEPLRYGFVGETPSRADLEGLSSLTRRLSAATGLPVIPADAPAAKSRPPNLFIVILRPDERAGLLDALSARGVPLERSIVRDWVRDPYTPCAGVLFADPQTENYVSAMIFISAELTGRLRRTCFEEELTQAFGLRNDHPEVRPSLFNDDNEFAVLTEHDVDLLRILYHPRLRSGMTRAEAMSLVPGIVAELRPDPR